MRIDAASEQLLVVNSKKNSEWLHILAHGSAETCTKVGEN